MKKISTNDYLTLSSDERYAEAVRVTMTTMEVADFNKYYRVTKNRWMDLTRVWDKVHTKEKHMVLNYALHNIYWGVYPYTIDDPNMHHLLSLVEAELLDDGEAFNAWNRWSVFKDLLDTMASEMVSYGESNLDAGFIEHHHYLRARLLCKVQYEKTRPDGFGEYVREYESYERIIARFIPEATTWTRKQWGDYADIEAALYNKYGIAYGWSSESVEDYDRTFAMLRELDCWGYNKNVLWYAANIRQFPLKMARCVWPINLEETVTKLFLDAHKATVHYEKSGQLCLDKKHKHFHPVGHFEREALKASWLYQNVNSWFARGKYTGEKEKEVKMALFDLQMTT